MKSDPASQQKIKNLESTLEYRTNELFRTQNELENADVRIKQLSSALDDEKKRFTEYQQSTDAKIQQLMSRIGEIDDLRNKICGCLPPPSGENLFHFGYDTGYRSNLSNVLPVKTTRTFHY